MQHLNRFHKIIIFEPYLNDNAFVYYKKFANALKTKTLLLTFKEIIYKSKFLTVVQITKSKFLHHTPKISNLYQILKAETSCKIFICMFELASPIASVTLYFRKKFCRNFVFVSYSFENQTLADSAKTFSNTLFSSGLLNSLFLFLKRIVRFLINEKIFLRTNLLKHTDVHFIASNTTKQIYKINKKIGHSFKIPYPTYIYKIKKIKPKYDIFVGLL